ncbi:hypothetical protein EZV62_010337 [Acer yangbiense]|uniref:G domain-containing protein n=1 Tax=Acer yangbiense TaxID=1000413 RepID=A0A5C7I1C7_9ROSI|nr:hypothetical protein EZV62_010337 [Acer yangbiense]
MKSQLSCSEEDDYDSSRRVNYWWRSAAKFDEYGKLKLDFLNVSRLTPRLRVLREMERLALIAPEGLNELRHKLHNYRSGDFWVPTGGIKREEMDIPPVITILLVGFSGSGKSSLINLMYSVLSRSGLMLFAQTSSGNLSNFTTMYMEEHNVLRSMRSGFCVYDSRGFEEDRLSEGLVELSSWMSEGVHHNQLCLRSVDYGTILKNEVDIDDDMRSSSKFVQRRVNCAMVVANVAEISKALKVGDSKPLEATRQLFCAPDLRKCNENPILILTHGDLLSAEERMEARLKICESLDISESNGVYDVVCLTEYGFPTEEYDPITGYAVTEAMYRALLISDRGHFPKKTLQDWAVVMLSWLMCFIAALFSCLADICSRLGHIDRKLK